MGVNENAVGVYGNGYMYGEVRVTVATWGMGG